MEPGASDGLVVLPHDVSKHGMEPPSEMTIATSQQPTVIQSTAPPVVQFTKGNVILLNKAGSVIQSTPASSLHTIQVVDAGGEGIQLEDEACRRRREILTRRPSYRKILNDLGGGEMSEDKTDADADSAFQGSNGIIKVVPANIQLSGAEPVQSLQTITMSSPGAAVSAPNGSAGAASSSSGNTIVQYTQTNDGQQYFVPVSIPVSGGLKLDASGQHMILTPAQTTDVDVTENVTKKREIRLYKNREAARECRRKKKEYIKCLESRVAVLENQNKALIEELKTLKELYCQKKLP